MTALRQQASFGGSVVYGWPEPTSDPAVLVCDSPAWSSDDAHRLGPRQRDAIVFGRRPTRADVDQLVAVVVERGATSLIVVGSGALIDVGKLVFQQSADANRALRLQLIPCGAEPYRAVAQFAVVDAEDGTRPTVVDPRFAAGEVFVVEELLARVPPRVLAVAAADTAVHAIESLLSAASTPYSRALAGAALRTVCCTREPRELLTASFIAVEAFASTRLGIAHAIASPLGTELAVTHDRINAVLGDALVEQWQRRAAAFAYVEDACPAGDTNGVRETLTRLREEAALPSTLSELSVPWETLARIIPRAAQSSGMAVLPQPISPQELEAFAERAWNGETTKEAAVAEPAGAD